MARTQGIPARTVGGYYYKSARIDYINWGSNVTNSTINHKFVQVYLNGKWIVIDPVADSYQEYLEETDTYTENLPDLDEKYKLICEQCDKTMKEFNEIMFGSPPKKNKVIIVRSIKDYDYSAYRKDIDVLNDYLNKGWTIVNHESDEFVHTYILGMPLKWLKEGDVNDE